MTREEATKCLKTMQHWIPDWDDREDGLSYWDAIDMALSTLTPPNEWVSVEERLPESQADVLVVAFWHECWQTMIGWHSDMGKKWRVITPHGEREPGGVTHWMPLTAARKREKHESTGSL